jgi:proteic killer suppression protein
MRNYSNLRGFENLAGFCLNRAIQPEDLYFPPSNKFHAPSGYEPARYAICIDRQWRITFEWHEGDAYNVLFEDYR